MVSLKGMLAVLFASLMLAKRYQAVSQATSFPSALSRLSRLEKVCFLDTKREWVGSVASEMDAIQDSMKALVYAMPHLSICMEVTDFAPGCFPVAADSFIADQIIDRAPLQQSLHLWAQVTSTGGKIQKSDAYINLDCRHFLHDYWLDREVIGMDVRFEVGVMEDCVYTRSGTHSPQVLFYPTRKYYQPGLACSSASEAVFQYKMVSVLSLQRHTAAFCIAHMLNSANCAHFSHELRQYLRRILQSEEFQLPRVQFSPTTANPFFFMHVDKTAGSTVRM